MSGLCGFLYTDTDPAGLRPERAGDTTRGEVQHT